MSGGRRGLAGETESAIIFCTGKSGAMMTVILDGVADMTLDNLARVALAGEKVRYGPRSLKMIDRSFRAFQTYVDKHRGIFIYGITASGGPTASKRRRPEDLRALNSRPNPFPGLSFADENYPEYIVRAAVFSRLACWLEGTSAISKAKAATYTQALDGPMPKVPAQGGIGAGEVVLGQALNRIMPRRSPNHYETGGNRSNFNNGMAGITAIFARRRLELATKVLALSIEGFKAPLEAYDPDLRGLWNDPYETAAINTLQAHLRGVPRKNRRFYQAPVSWRIIPRVLGQAYRSVAAMEAVATAGLRDMASNPTYIPPSRAHPLGHTISTGSYHNAISSAAFDNVTSSWADLGEIMHRQAVKFHKGEVSLLPDRLLPQGTDYLTGVSTTYLEYVANGFLEEMRMLTAPTLLTAREPAASEQDDINISGPLGWMKEDRASRLFDKVMAVLAATASQALHITERKPPPRLAEFTETVRRYFPPVTATRVLGNDAKRLADAFARSVTDGEVFEKPGKVSGGKRKRPAARTREMAR